MSTILFVPGANLGSWAFQDVVAGLADRGHDAHAVTLTGLAERAGQATPDTDLRTHVDDVVAAVRDLPAGDVVLVGHSYAGAVVVNALPEVADRVSRLVLLAGTVLPVGETLLEQLPPGAEPLFLATVVDGDHGPVLPPMEREVLDTWWGDHGLTGAVWDRYRRCATAQPVACFRTPAWSSPDAEPQVPRTSITCTGDPGGPPALGAQWATSTMPTGHWPMLSAPKLLVDGLHDLVG